MTHDSGWCQWSHRVLPHGRHPRVSINNTILQSYHKIGRRSISRGDSVKQGALIPKRSIIRMFDYRHELNLGVIPALCIYAVVSILNYSRQHRVLEITVCRHTRFFSRHSNMTLIDPLLHDLEDNIPQSCAFEKLWRLSCRNCKTMIVTLKVPIHTHVAVFI